MAITKEKKQEIIKELKDKIDLQKSAVFIDYAGTNVKDLTKLRKELRAQGNELRIAKKTLLNRAFEEKEVAVNVRDLEGQVAVVFGFEDEISPSKNVYQFSKTHETIKMVGGILEGTFYGASEMIKIAELPSKQQLLGSLVGTLNAPVTSFAHVLSGTISQFVQALSQIRDNK
ncbi:MAG: 50S ribosomal protein L10 [Candidatus Pacebacteria bacterium]|nr:50S ribosomal protein L10 [Candidatus Paceibacterota bacterium]MDD4333877.1 50S ribosomal protein L10 [Candidatus Paceibacterota bacterium]